MKKLKMNESAFNKLLNEISYDTVEKASKKSRDVFGEMYWKFQNFYDEVCYINDEVCHDDDKENPYVKKIKAYADAIDAILSAKNEQGERFDDEIDNFDWMKYENDPSNYENGDMEDGKYEDYYDKDLRQLQAKYPKG